MTKGDQTRQKIMRAAATMFNQRGYEGASLAELMTATGLKKGGIYRHFTSKEELAGEAFDYTWQSAWKARMLHVDMKAPGVEPLKQLIANFVEHRSPIAGGCPILNTAVDADDGNLVLRDRVNKALQSWITRMQRMLQRAAKRGEIRAGIEPKDVANLIVAALEGALMMSRLQGNDYPLRNAQRFLNHYLETEIATQAPTLS